MRFRIEVGRSEDFERDVECGVVEKNRAEQCSLGFEIVWGGLSGCWTRWHRIHRAIFTCKRQERIAELTSPAGAPSRLLRRFRSGLRLGGGRSLLSFALDRDLDRGGDIMVQSYSDVVFADGLKRIGKLNSSALDFIAL